MFKLISLAILLLSLFTGQPTLAQLLKDSTLLQKSEPTTSYPSKIIVGETLTTRPTLKFEPIPEGRFVLTERVRRCREAIQQCLAENLPQYDPATQTQTETSAAVIDRCVEEKGATCNSVCREVPVGTSLGQFEMVSGSGIRHDVYCYDEATIVAAFNTCYSDADETTQVLEEGNEYVYFCYEGQTFVYQFENIHQTSDGQHTCTYSGFSIVPHTRMNFTCPPPEEAPVCVTSIQEKDGTCILVLRLASSASEEEEDIAIPDPTQHPLGDD